MLHRSPRKTSKQAFARKLYLSAGFTDFVSSLASANSNTVTKFDLVLDIRELARTVMGKVHTC
jgi:hypothetical protein